MSSLIIKSILEQAVAALTPQIDCAFENVKYVPTDGVPYQQVQIMWAKPDNPVMNKGFHRERGFLQITLQYPSGAGGGLAQAQAELIRASFFKAASFTQDQITVTVDGTPAISPGRNDADRWAVPIKIPFFANIFE